MTEPSPMSEADKAAYAGDRLQSIGALANGNLVDMATGMEMALTEIAAMPEQNYLKLLTGRLSLELRLLVHWIVSDVDGVAVASWRDHGSLESRKGLYDVGRRRSEIWL